MKIQRTLLVAIGLGDDFGDATPVLAGNEAEVGATYYKDVLPIMQENCQTCHGPSGRNISGLVAPMSFTDYQETRPWLVRSRGRSNLARCHLGSRRRRRGSFPNERILTDAEIETILNWVEAGAPAGNLADAPPAKRWVEERNDDWSLGTPDFVVKMPEPYLIEDDIYDLNISFYKKLTEAELPADVWLRGWEFRTGDSRVTHHMCSSMLPPSATAPADGAAVEDEGADVRGSRSLAASPRAPSQACSRTASAYVSRRGRTLFL